jgi:MFS family permease
MIVCDSLSAALTIALAGLLATGHLVVWHIYLAAAVTSLLGSFRWPAFAASIPLITATEQLPRTNAMVQTSGAAASICGPLLAGVLVSSINLSGVLIIDALTFLIGVATLALVRIPRTLPAVSDMGPSFLREAAAGWQYVQQRPGLLGLLAVYGFKNFVFAIASILIAPLLLSFTTPAKVGLQYAISGCGLLVGGSAMTAFGGPRKRINGVLLYTSLGGVCLAAHGMRPSFILITAAGFILFMTLPGIDASNTSIWQSKVPAYLQGRCFAMQQILLSVAMGIGYCLAGPLSDYVFGPMLRHGGLLAGSVGTIIGVGPGRGIGLMFICLGTLMALVAIAAYCVPAVRKIDELKDAVWSSPEAVFAGTGRE